MSTQTCEAYEQYSPRKGLVLICDSLLDSMCFYVVLCLPFVQDFALIDPGPALIDYPRQDLSGPFHCLIVLYPYRTTIYGNILQNIMQYTVLHNRN